MYNIDYTKLGAKIRLKRREKGYTQEKLAELCDISTGFLGHIEKGTRKLSLDTLYCIAVTLNISLDYLLLDSSFDTDNFLNRITAYSASPESYNAFCKAVKVLAEHMNEL